MRVLQIPVGAIAALSGATGLLSTSPRHDPRLGVSDQPDGSYQRLLAPSISQTICSDLPPASPPSVTLLLRNLLPGITLPSPALLLPLVTTCKADASSYESLPDQYGTSSTPVSHAAAAAAAAATAIQAAESAAATPGTPSARAGVSPDGDDGGDGDTITGVFHRLDPGRAKLVQVQVVFRHGARTPLSSRREMWGGQPWDVCGEAYQAAAVRLFSTAGVENPESKHDARQRSVVYDGGCRKGQLTLVGQLQARDLGRWLRGRYVAHLGFLPESHQDGVLQARTTNFSRTVATLRGVVTGLYPDLAPGQRQQHQQRSPAPEGATTAAAPSPAQTSEGPTALYVTTSGDLDEILYADTRACPHLKTFLEFSKEAGRASVRADPEYEWARGKLSPLLGIDEATFDSAPWIFTDLHDNLTSLATHGKQLPPGFEQQTRLMAAINRLATKEFAAEIAPSVRDALGRSVLRLSMGRLLHTLAGNMRRAVEGGALEEGGAGAEAAAGAADATGGAPQSTGGQPLMYMYSGHDSTIMPLLSALGHEVQEWPPYLSNLVFELWQLPPGNPASSSSPDPSVASSAGSSSAPPAAPPAAGRPRYVVRVLYNQTELPLPQSPPGFHPSFSTFQREVVGPFLLSQQHHQQLCSARVDHQSAMPTPHQHSSNKK